MATTASLVMTAAHAAASLADKLVAYRTRFTTALRAAWAATKQPFKTLMKNAVQEQDEMDARLRAASAIAVAPSWFIMEQDYSNVRAPHMVHEAFQTEQEARAALAGPEYKGTFAYVKHGLR